MKKPLIALGIIAVIAGAALSVYFIASNLIAGQKMTCESSIGNITLLHNDKEIKGYTTTGEISYDLDEQQPLSRYKGIDAYLDEFEDWFEYNTNGTCTRE